MDRIACKIMLTFVVGLIKIGHVVIIHESGEESQYAQVGFMATRK